MLGLKTLSDRLVLFFKIFCRFSFIASEKTLHCSASLVYDSTEVKSDIGSEGSGVRGSGNQMVSLVTDALRNTS